MPMHSLSSIKRDINYGVKTFIMASYYDSLFNTSKGRNSTLLFDKKLNEIQKRKVEDIILDHGGTKVEFGRNGESLRPIDRCTKVDFEYYREKDPLA